MSMHTLMLDERPMNLPNELHDARRFGLRMFWWVIAMFIVVVSLSVTNWRALKTNTALNQEVMRLRIELRELKEMQR